MSGLFANAKPRRIKANHRRRWKRASAHREYQHTDALGSPVTVTSSTGAVLERFKYEPYGKRIGGVPKDGPGYTGHVLDVETGLNYMQQRYYDPEIGRFLSVDPVTANSGTGANFNRYWYANNNPYRFTDPDGRRPRGGGTLCSETSQCETGSFGGEGGGGGGGGDRVSASEGATGKYSREGLGWHDYTKGPNPVCSPQLACTDEEMRDYARRFGVPGQDPSQPVSDGSINNVYDPRYGFFAGKVTTDISRDGLTVSNTTLPFHLLYDGRIDRTFSRGQDGGWSATTHGYGNNVLPGAWLINQWQGPKIFRELDRQMRIYIEIQKRSP